MCVSFQICSADRGRLFESRQGLPISASRCKDNWNLPCCAPHLRLVALWLAAWHRLSLKQNRHNMPTPKDWLRLSKSTSGCLVAAVGADTTGAIVVFVLTMVAGDGSKQAG